jgi:hypothetical protein
MREQQPVSNQLEAPILLKEDGKSIEPLFTKEGIALYPPSVIAFNMKMPQQRIIELARQGRIHAVCPARDWFVSLEDVKKFRDKTGGKPGRPKKLD